MSQPKMNIFTSYLLFYRQQDLITLALDSEEEWQALLDEFQRSMNKFAIGSVEQKELLDLINSTKKEIVTS